MISEAPRHELGAEVTLDYEAAGLYWSLEIPANRAVDLDEDDTGPVRS